MIPKFRAYNPATNYWYDPTEVFVNNGDIYIDDEDFEGFIRNNDIELMQSTGFFDKNGVEVFEGDVLKTSLFPFKTGRVIYDRFRYSFRVSCDGVSNPLYCFDWSNAKVIGNIYKNPELVEVKND